MTGPEHYQEAEQLLAAANRRAEEAESGFYEQTMAEAQVHATLAGVAAAMHPQLGGAYQLDEAWRKALGIPEQD